MLCTRRTVRRRRAVRRRRGLRRRRRQGAGALGLDAREDRPEEPRDDVGGRVAEVHDAVDAARPQQRRVQLLDVVGGHDQDAALGRGHAVDDVEEARQRDALGRRVRGRRRHGAVRRGRPVLRPRRLVALGGRVERRGALGREEARRVDVLEQHDAAPRQAAEQPAERLLGQGARVEADDVDAQAQQPRGGEAQRRLARAGRAVQQVAAAVGDAAVGVPAAGPGVQVLAHVVDDHVLLGLVEHDGRHGPRRPRQAARPLGAVGAAGVARGPVDDGLAAVARHVGALRLVQQRLEDGRVAAQARQEDLLRVLAAPGHLVLLARARDRQPAALVAEVVRAVRRRVVQRLHLVPVGVAPVVRVRQRVVVAVADGRVALVVLVVALVRRVDHGAVDRRGRQEVGRGLRDALLGDPEHEVVVELVVEVDLGGRDQVLVEEVEEGVLAVPEARREGQQGDDAPQILRDVDVEVDGEEIREEGEARDERLEQRGESYWRCCGRHDRGSGGVLIRCTHACRGCESPTMPRLTSLRSAIRECRGNTALCKAN